MKQAPVFPRSAVFKCPRLLLVIALVVTALVVAGCRSSDSTPGNGKSPTQTVAPGY
jgi:predicted small secreted protein